MTMSTSSAPASIARGVSGAAGAGGARFRIRDERGIDAHGGDRRDGRVARVGALRLLAQGVDLAPGVLPLEGREIDHADRQVERPELGLALDGALRQARRALLDADLVDVAG